MIFPLKMHRQTAWLVLVSSVFFQAMGFSLFDRQTSYAQLERWPAVGNGTSRVSFRFKTYAKTGLLFYVDDEGDAQYLSLHLHDGFLVMELGDGTEDFKTLSKTRVNDIRWHEIAFEITSPHAVCELDDMTLAEYNISMLALKSAVYIGGLQNTVNSLYVTYNEVEFMQRFLGCVEDVRYGNATTDWTVTVVRSSGMSGECKDACRPQNPCRNHGVCINKFAMAECICTGTGFRGETCQEESPVVGIPTAYDRVIIDIHSRLVYKPDATSILLRFRSVEPNGVFFFTGYKGDYIVLKLTNGKVATSVNLGSGSVTITTKNGGYNDNQWHSVKLERFERTVNLTVDYSDTSKGVTPGAFTRFSLPDPTANFFLGGFSDARSKLKSTSRKDFIGCLQELVFNDYDFFSKLFAKTSEVRSRGNVTRTCPEVKVSTTAQPELTSAIAPTTGITTSPLDVLSTTSKGSGFSSPSPSPRGNTTKSAVSKSTIDVSTPEVKRWHSDTTTSTSHLTLTRTQNPSEDTVTKDTPISFPDYKTPPRRRFRSTESLLTNTQPGFSESEDYTDQPGTFLDRTTNGVVMANRNERKEKDLTLWFILAACVGIVAFLLAIAIIIKVNSANRKKYEIKKSTAAALNDTGSFQRSSNNTKYIL